MSAELPGEKIGVVGLGYVGLPLAVAFAKYFDVVAYDRSEPRVQELRQGDDHTGEVDPPELVNDRLTFTLDPEDLTSCTFIIVAVPTPINHAREPDLTPLIGASETVGRILRPGMIVAYESTVYPGVTEDVCLPILERESGLKKGVFELGYSPERVNPGDREHRIETIVKVVSGSSPEALERVAAVYGSVVKAGVHKAPNIKTAEASKVIENVQRDLNIALMNELSKIFAHVGINTDEVLAAAGTKWNFHHYTPGLVGGHCIGVDPYYLTHKALEMGYHPEVILAGRRINDSMGRYVAELAIHEMSAAGIALLNARVWVLGMTFKENVPDLRNTRAVDVIAGLRNFAVDVFAWEPLLSADKIEAQFGVGTFDYAAADQLDAVILLNGHEEFKQIDLAGLRAKMRTPVLIDAKNFFPRDKAAELGFRHVTL